MGLSGWSIRSAHGALRPDGAARVWGSCAFGGRYVLGGGGAYGDSVVGAGAAGCGDVRTAHGTGGEDVPTGTVGPGATSAIREVWPGLRTLPWRYATRTVG
jgi:hypothetical protein